MVLKKVNGKTQLYQGIKHTSRRVLDCVYPPVALRYLDRTGKWQDITFLDDPCCDLCGFPFDYEIGQGALCARCIARPPKFDRARAAFKYDEHSRGLVLAFKHGGYRDNLTMFSNHIKRAGRQFWMNSDIVIPVPLHPKRLIKRRFNQASILARRVAHDVNIPFRPDILLRHRNTESQGLQSVKGRFRNVRAAFSVAEGKEAELSGLSFVLIDDVYTTGATLNACAKTLKKAGARRVNVVCLARVVRGQPLPT